MTDYRELKQKYTLFARAVSLLGCTPLVICLLTRANIMYVLFCIVILLIVFCVCALFLNNWYVKRLQHLLYEDMDMNSWEQFIQLNSLGRFSKTRLQAKFATVTYRYMVGDFSRVIQTVQEFEEKDRLTQRQKEILAEYQVSAHLLSQREGSDRPFQDILDSESVHLTQSIEQKCRAIYDIVIQKQATDYFDHINTSSKFIELEALYFRARSEILRGGDNEAKRLFAMIAQEDNRLYFVREAKAYLGTMKAEHK